MPLIIPQFDLSQDDKFVTIKLRLPYVKVSKSEFSILTNQFTFYLRPYLLELVFKQELKEMESPIKLQYDPELQILTVYLQKANAEEHFEDLDMISLLLKQKKSKQELKQQKPKQKPLIEVIKTEASGADVSELDQKQEIQGVVDQFTYGFNNIYSDVFNDLEEELMELSIIDPKRIPIPERHNFFKIYQTQQFDKDAYLFDFLENEQVDTILESDPKSIIKSEFYFTIDEIKILEKLPFREYLIESTVEYGLIDILFAYLYEFNIMQGDITSESAVTINQMSTQFSGFYLAQSLKEQLIYNYERALCFPLIRSFEICQKVQGQILDILSQEQKLITKYFLQLYQLFQQNKPRNYLNTIYIYDYLIYLQTAKLDYLKQEFKKIMIVKEDLSFDLRKLEEYGTYEALKQEQDA